MIQTASPVAPLFEILPYLVDEHVGIITHVGEFPVEPGGPDFFHFYGQACDTSAFVNQKNFGTTGGASADRGLAMAKAIGEAIERYCSAIYIREDFPLKSYESAPFSCIAPHEFALYSPAQYARPGFPYRPFRDSTPVRWAPMIDPLSDAVWHVPAGMVVMPYFWDTEAGEAPIAQPITTGLACHCSWEQAALSAIGEVIERDAFTITWQAKMGMPKVRLDTLSLKNRDLVRRFEKTGHRVTILHLAMDHGIPTILSVLRHSSPKAPAFLVAASSELDPEEAVRKSLEELAHTRRLAMFLTATLPPIAPGTNHDHIIDQDGHIHLYCDQGNVPLTDFLFLSDQEISFQDIQNRATGDYRTDLSVCLERIASVGHHVLLADLTTPDVKELGLSVARALIPGFHPLTMGHLYRALGGTRLWTVPQKLGHPGITPESGDNPLAHPYP